MPNIRHALLIGAPADAVYDALTREEGLSSWWTPQVRTTAEPDSIARFDFGPDYFKEMRIVDVTPPRHVKWHCVKGVDEWVGTTLSFSIDGGGPEALMASHPEADDQIEQLGSRPEMTLLTLAHDGWRAETPMYAECNYTWGQFLRGLKRFCETGRGQPWPCQHQEAA